MRRATLGQELVEFLTQSQASQRIFVGCLALLVHDWFLTFGDEVAYIWRSDWRIPKILFLLNRYPVIANAVLQVTYTMMISATNLSNCEMLLKAIISMKFAGIIVSEVILFLKVLSLYRNSHAVYATLGLFASFCMISAVIVIIIWADSVRWTSTPLHLFQGCIPQASMAIIADVWIMVVWEILIVGMAIYKSYRTWRESTSSLFGVLYKDGIHYFGLALASSVANLALSLAIVSHIPASSPYYTEFMFPLP
ncbi:hypothetical protein SISSUDRAFT_365406 [Sistotremastrum suecicum HHB10207 ss-3]|uniref:DUF6533 domain-containing protein n=1 Tax=Sistotremastrum suecicum HHB10207 ss-3 TaxID=1314776 RepID=A0A165Z3V3_9AGAM|nr:hypothetical protein SISSUDRAFT_365406 [Sistotremastrum suecicum HHB10207 ss-3]